MSKFQPGDTVYFVESNYLIRNVTVKKLSAGLVLIQTPNDGCFKVRENRLFDTLEEAMHHVRKFGREPTIEGVPKHSTNIVQNDTVDFSGVVSAAAVYGKLEK